MSLMLRKWILNSIIKNQPARKPIAQLNRIESLPNNSQVHGHFKLACISDKEKFIRAVFTKDSLVQLEQSDTALDDMRGGLISLQDYTLISSIGIDKRFSEYFVEVHKFNFIGGERCMPFPTLTNVNLDERVQSKLAQVWREEQLNRRGDDEQQNVLRLCSQTEDAPQLSQDDLSMLLAAMSEQSQVDSIEAISSSQLFELENIPGWMKPEKGPQLRGDQLTQETEYATPLMGPNTTRSDSSSHDTPVSDGTYRTPPERLTSPLVATAGMNQQQQVSERLPADDDDDDDDDDDVEEPLEVTTVQQNSINMSTSLQTVMEAIQNISPVQQMLVEGVKETSGILQQAVHNVSEMLSKPLLAQATNKVIMDDEGTGEEIHESHVVDEDMDYCCEISYSQVVDLDAVWSKEQPLLPAIISVTTAKESTDSGCDILVASGTPSNRLNCYDNDINDNGCSEQNTAIMSSRQQEENKQKDKQGLLNQQQQVTERKQHTDKGKGGTTKNIYQVDKPLTTNDRPVEYEMLDDDISISSSQQDELDRQWVGNDEANNSMASSLEGMEDLHPFQLTSLPDPIKNVTDVHQPLTKISENEPGSSNIVSVAMDTGSDFIPNQEARRKVVFNDDDNMGLDSLDQHLFSQAVAETATTQAKMQTSLVSTTTIARLLDVSNQVPPATDPISDKTIPTTTGNIKSTPLQMTTSEHNGLQPENSQRCNVVSHEMNTIAESDSNDSNDVIVNSKKCTDDKMMYYFKPLITEEDIDEFIDNYWMLQQLRTFNF